MEKTTSKRGKSDIFKDRSDTDADDIPTLFCSETEVGKSKILVMSIQGFTRLTIDATAVAGVMLYPTIT